MDNTQPNKDDNAKQSENRFQHLKNGNAKCLGVKGGPNQLELAQQDCRKNDKGQHWKRRDRHLCNAFDKCLAVRSNVKGKAPLIHSDYSKEDGQQWIDEKSGLLVNLHGLCAAIEGDSRDAGAKAISKPCNATERGQIWSFLPL